MSEVKSPFLDDEKKVNSECGNQPVVSGVDAGSGNNEGSFSVTTGAGGETRQKSVIDSKRSIPTIEANDKELGSLEIKEDGKVLRNIIIIMTILLVLSLLGLIAYNLLNKNGGSSDPKVLEEETSVKITNFEMKGKEFKVGSIIIEQ